MAETKTEDKTDSTTLNLYQKIATITGEVGKVEKTGRNQAQGYSFIEQSAVVAAVRPLLAEYMVTIIEHVKDINYETFQSQNREGKTVNNVRVLSDMVYEVINADKPEERFEVAWKAEALDTSDKAINKVLTAAEKTFLMKLFKISDRDDADADHIEAPASPPRPTMSGKPTEKQIGFAKKLLIDHNIVTANELKGAYKAFAGVNADHLEDLDKAQLSGLIDALNSMTTIDIQARIIENMEGVS